MNAATPTISTDVAAASRVVDAPADVVELARAAARQDAGGAGLVGGFVDAVSEDDVALTLRFATTEVAYTGWTWCVTVALVDPAQPTISEVVLLPGPDSLLPPPWLPWNERIRPGDLGPGDLLLAPAEDDPRLVPAYVESDDPAVEDVAHELGVGRVRVMSRAGRIDTAERWHDSAFGPTADMAKQAPLHCVMCAFFLPLAGSLGAQFGACGNEMSPADGRIVDLGYGCGAHSENVIEPVPTGFRPSHIDDTVLDVHPRTAAGGLADGAAAFLGEDDSELEVGPTHGNVEPALEVGEVGGAVAVGDTVEAGGAVEVAATGDVIAEETAEETAEDTAAIEEIVSAEGAGDVAGIGAVEVDGLTEPDSAIITPADADTGNETDAVTDTVTETETDTGTETDSGQTDVVASPVGDEPAVGEIVLGETDLEVSPADAAVPTDETDTAAAEFAHDDVAVEAAAEFAADELGPDGESAPGDAHV